ncbi:MAG: PAS domain-containing protein [Kofleriaceae bacterium]|nr:PAS domain-containing protein [Kofleriaceae bacterium]
MTVGTDHALWFARMAERLPDGVLVLRRAEDRELRVAYANRAITWLGTSTLYELLDGSALARWRSACEDALSLDRELQVSLPLPDCTERHATVVPLDPMTVAVQLRADLVSEVSSRFDLLFSQNVHGVFVARLDEPFHWPADEATQDARLDYAFDHLRVTAVNDAMCRQFEKTREELVGTPARARWWLEPQRWRDQMRLLYSQGHTHLSVAAPKGDGRTFDVEGEYVCTYDAEGRITGYYGIQRDISIRRTAVKELETSRERLELAIVGADLGVWEVDLPNQRVWFDGRFLARFGYDAADQWRSFEWWRSLFHPDDLPEAQRTLDAHLRGLEPLFRLEFRMRTASGDWLWVQSTGRIPKEQPQRILGVSVDITERRALQERVARSERLAALGTMAAGVGHEINNPLTFVVLTLSLMERALATLPADSTTSEAFGALIQRARYGADRISAVVRDLQTVARPATSGSAVTNPVPVVERCLQIADHQVRHRAHVICDFGPTPSVQCSEDRLVQVFLILIINAAQAIPDGQADKHWIRISTSTSSDGRVAIEISDNGAGIPPEDIGHVFEPFFTTKRGADGTGLGLSICRGIIASLGGEIELDSAPGRGSRFRVLLPAAATLEPRPTPPAPALSSVRRVLVIDDEPMLGVLVKSVLDGIEVTTETCAKAALARLAAGESYDRILCDMMMPELSGIDFYERVDEALRPHIVFITGASFTERVREFLARVPNRLLLKPFDSTSLATALAD